MKEVKCATWKERESLFALIVNDLHAMARSHPSGFKLKMSSFQARPETFSTAPDVDGFAAVEKIGFDYGTLYGDSL